MPSRTPEQKEARRAYERSRRADPTIQEKIRANQKRSREKRRREDPEAVVAQNERKRQRYQSDESYRAKILKRQLENNVVSRYGLTLAERDHRLAAQGGKCALPYCGRDVGFGQCGANWQRGAAVDHCHVTGRVRGILCGGCNTALGRLGDTVEAIESVLAYVRGSQQ